MIPSFWTAWSLRAWDKPSYSKAMISKAIDVLHEWSHNYPPTTLTHIHTHAHTSHTQTPGFSGMVTPTNGRRRKRSSTGVSQPHPPSSTSSSREAVSGDYDALELRDLVVQLRRDMNSLRTERDQAKAQQVSILVDVVSLLMSQIHT